MFPAVRLDRIDVFTTLKIQRKTLSTKASFYQCLGLDHRELASNFRWYLELTGRGQGHYTTSSRPNCRVDAYLGLQGVGHNGWLTMSRAVRAQIGNHCRDFFKDEIIRRKDHI